MNLKDEVWDTQKNTYVNLEKVLMEAKNNNNPLFLAVEQGARKYRNNVNIVVNPQTRFKSRNWLSEEYPRMIFKEIKL